MAEDAARARNNRAGLGLREPRCPIYGNHAMIVSGHAAASQAGIAMHRRGGNAVDAMIAASAALTVVLGHATSLGGDCFILYHDAASGRIIGLNASGVAPQLATRDRFAGGLKAQGPLAPVVPGLVAAWETMHRRFGKLPWRELFTDATALAEAHPISAVLARNIGLSRATLASDAGCAALYLPGGRPLNHGDTLRQPELAAMLRQIADGGAASFYRGPIAEKIDAFMTARGGLMRASDLAAFAPLWVEPASTTYRGHRVSVMPPNSYGMLLLMQLNGLKALERGALTADPARRIGYQMNAMKAAFAYGVPLIADPRMAPDAVDRLLAPDMVERLQRAVLGEAPSPRVPDRSGTSCLLVADASGNAVCVVQSVFAVFGGYCRDPATGILFNNRMSGFTAKPGEANTVAPGKRPAHTLCPVMVQRDGRLRYLIASPGGLSQTVTNTQVLGRLIDDGVDVAAAVEAPRWCNTAHGDDFLLERELPESFLAALAAMGHKVRRAEDPFYYGSAKAIEILPSGNFAGAGDHRREAFALGY
ncbi:MAG TPA: gamma-glutamyltransferase family protein [Stellaceae bacterium]|jgi:gamma-glutamyltranspeptidase/glutathione hydrolase